MNAEEAVHRAQEWLRTSPDGDLTAGGTAALRIRAEHVVRATDGWTVTYNSVGWLDGTDPGRGLFPDPVVFVPDGGGEPTQDQAVESLTEWLEVVDPEFDPAAFPELTVPRAAVLGWEQRTLHGKPTGVHRDNAEYRPGPRFAGCPESADDVGKLLGYVKAGWLDETRFVAMLLDLDVLLAIDTSGAAITSDRRFLVYTAPEAMPGNTAGWRRIQPRVLLRDKPGMGLLIDQDGRWAMSLPANVVAGASGPAPHPDRERAPADEVPAELAVSFPQLAAEFGDETVTNLRARLTEAGQRARKNGYALSVEECLTYARGYCYQRTGTSPPADLFANGLVTHRTPDGDADPVPWTLGKFATQGIAECDIAWHRLLGAYVGFAIGDALGSGASGELPLGGLTRQLLLHTESLIRGLPPVPAPGGIPAALPTVGRPDSWLTMATADAGPAPAEFSTLLAAALPAAVSGGVPSDEVDNDGYTREVVREMIGAVASGTEVGLATDALVWLFRQVLRPADGRRPLWHFLTRLSEHEDFAAVGELAKSVVALRQDRNADGSIQDDVRFDGIDDGRTPLSVLGRALFAATRWDHDPERALTLATRAGPIAGALAGALLGARLGVPGLPPEWVKSLTPLGLLDQVSNEAFGYFTRDVAPTIEPRSRLRGSLLAGAIGDALGAKTEFDSIDRIRELTGPAGITDFIPAYGGVGRITDDTQMTLLTVEALIRAHAQARRGLPADLTESLQLAYQRWLHTQGVPWPRARGPQDTTEEPDGWLISHGQLFSRRAPGLTCFSELEAYGKTGVRASVDRPVNNSKGCGGVMRAAPIALWSDDLAEVFTVGAASAALTHGHPSGFLSSGAFAVIMNQLLHGKPLLDAVVAARAELVKHPGHEEQTVALEQALKLARDGQPTPEKLETLGEGNIGETALSMAVYVALATTDANTALLASVNHSGDSDSTGSMCGNLVGALYGEEALRQDLLERLELREVIGTLADDALAEFGPDAPVHDEWYRRYPAH
ncbi:ADP-ribosylglycohydrolase family protein [Amycolatopsis sp. H20-H5]|uniref:ADP-ribosylglycohydrolase family protein n=1 Tax=Amycolatopsis sp. H20-H5 TaxID=3046309 RepID=UPI002DB61163|nr:ADP-ribosylglycohydrolase family protein [Amycolatopsis sp. H20-H5]MEC3974641.1 ADP-ribosylglycohydrolase family protein [Amycolatopsis sp. H20-H5]